MKRKREYIAWLVIGLYAAIYVGWDMLHAQVHQEAVVSHTVQVEKDSCHRSVFHGAKDNHKSHLTAFKHCASCHVVSQPPACSDALISLRGYPAISEKVTALTVFKPQQAVSLFSSRAPPAIV